MPPLKNYLATTSVLALSLTFGISGIAQAQETSDAAEGESLGTLVLTVEEQLKQALGVSTITSEDLAKTPVANDISEIIRKMPGVNLTGATASGQRGNQRQIDLRGMGPENTLILIDGKPVQSRNAVKMGRNGERDTRGDSNWVPADLIESIEVIRGPAAARYGSGAAGGVVNIITKRPDTQTGSVGLNFNSPASDKEGNSRRGTFMLAGPAGERLSYRIFGNIAKSDGDAGDRNPERTNSDGETVAPLAGVEGVENKDIGGLLTWQVADGHQLDFEANFSRQGNAFAGDSQLGGRPSNSATNPTLGDDYAALLGTETNRMYRRTFALTHRGDYDFGTSNSYLQFENTSNTRLCEGTGGSTEGQITYCADTDGDDVNDAFDFKTSELKNITAKTEWNLPLNMGSKAANLTLGAEVRHEKIDDPNTVAATDLRDKEDDEGNPVEYPGVILDPSERPSTLEQTTVGLYAEANIEWSEKLTLTPGLRFDYSDAFGSNLSPSLNAEYAVDDNWTIKVGVARAFKAPNVYQLNPNYIYNTMGNGCPWVDGVKFDGPCQVAGNPDLDAEISWNKEVGVAYAGENGVNASLTYFHNDYKNKIYSGRDPINNSTAGNILFRWENTGPAVIEGLEGNFGAEINDRLSMNANFTYMLDSRIKSSGQPLSLVPDYTINASVDYSLRDDLLVMLSATHYGKIQPSNVNASSGAPLQDGDGNPIEPNGRGSYTLWNVGMKWDVTETAQLSAGVTNLFDKEIYRSETNTGANTYNEPGRAVYISLHKSF